MCSLLGWVKRELFGVGLGTDDGMKGDRSWQFVVPLALAEIFPFTLRPVSIVLLSTNLVGAVLGSFAGSFVDKSSRPFGRRITKIGVII